MRISERATIESLCLCTDDSQFVERLQTLSALPEKYELRAQLLKRIHLLQDEFYALAMQTFLRKSWKWNAALRGFHRKGGKVSSDNKNNA